MTFLKIEDEKIKDRYFSHREQAVFKMYDMKLS